ncbi:MAG: hypothetical protein HYV15_01610 [Elusimicrobia bacterium]|nr:hypothetical protein [Elusimicrobiota bacterium]
MKTSLLTALIGTLLAGTALAAPVPAKPAPAAPAAAPLSAREIFGDAAQRRFSPGIIEEGFRIAGCPVGQEPKCTNWETTMVPHCVQWESRDGGSVCAKWMYESFKDCKAWACDEPH